MAITCEVIAAGTDGDLSGAGGMLNARGKKVIQQTLALLCAVLVLSGCASGRSGPPADTEAPKGPHKLKSLSVVERRQIMERARIWQSVNTSSLNLVAGPALSPAQRIGAETTCTFVFPDKPLTGMTPKFQCAIQKDDEVKVKYGEKNGEVYAEVAASRLFWALGFKADAMVPSRVTCRGCPEDPFAVSSVDWQRGAPTNVATRVFQPAIIEREVTGKKVEVNDYEGWAWPELDQIRERGGGATRAHIDALKLLAVFVQHSDSKPEQQELVCADDRVRKDARGNETCASAWLVVKDLGATFGKATMLNGSKIKLSDWGGEPIWKDPKQCVGNLSRSFTGSLEDPSISEAGRRFLAERLQMLSDRQLRDLFTVSRVEMRGEEMTGVDGNKRKVTIDDWVRVFKRKRSEITAARCQA